MKIIIKVGTQAILTNDGQMREDVIKSLVNQIASVQKQGHHVVFVSSGAVGSGRRVARESLGRKYGDSIAEKQVLASLGQHELMRTYATLFKPHGLLSSQLLLTKQDFRTKKHYYNIAQLLRETLNHKHIIPIINENDSVAIEELMFTDNDELSGLLAAQIGADKLIILSSIRGVYDAHPDEPFAKLIPTITAKEIRSFDKWPNVSPKKSTHGRGGMVSKLSTARKMSLLGITTHIAHVDEPDILLKLINSQPCDSPLGTMVLPSTKQSGTKRWMAFQYDQASGSIHLNPCLSQILKERQQVLSILPVGIERLTGFFEKGDLVDIIASDGQKIGIGIARYGSEKLKEFTGQKNKQLFIHYDYLYIDNLE